ncbi:MetQ/NlpA family ABC transporter substrate-binding protein [Leptotrichia wadei]|uniref:NLPA lipoprotein n=1 Tax=Leptotrichia wadei (strain F0279) TaxID=888055 RepID=U2PXU0_LEPWF|nr:MetQ/NlpA family ABC transporter substrate-binding protein [Leptotrichia wadei]ERK48916.1 NLPA lipoprotein [Leptotrichia wadei F0279]
MKRKSLVIITLLSVFFLIIGCGKKTEGNKTNSGDKKVIKYGKASGPYTVLFEKAIIPILEKKGYKFEVVEFSDLLQNDTALNEGDIDVNVEQHTAYMNNFNDSQKGNLVALTPIPTVPAGIFSSKHKSLNELKDGAKIAIPSDASNAARGYNLLQKAGWIKLNENINVAKATQKDIKENTHKLEIVEMDSANIPRSLDDFDYAVIPGSIVYSAGINPSTVLLQEDILNHLLLQVVVKKGNENSDWAKAIVEAYHSDEFKKYMEQNNKGLWFIPNNK